MKFCRRFTGPIERCLVKRKFVSMSRKIYVRSRAEVEKEFLTKTVVVTEDVSKQGSFILIYIIYYFLFIKFDILLMKRKIYRKLSEVIDEIHHMAGGIAALNVALTAAIT